MKSNDESFIKKSPVNKAFEKGRFEMETVKRLGLTSQSKRNSLIEDIILSPMKTNSSTSNQINQVQLKIPTTHPQVHRGVLRQFDPLLEMFDETEEKRKKTVSKTNTKSSYNKIELTATESLNDLAKQTQYGDTIVNPCATNVLVSSDKKTSQTVPSIENLSRLSTIDETSIEDLTETSSTLTISGIDRINSCENEMSVDLLGIDKFLPNLYDQPSKTSVEEISSCSSCLSYTTSCSTLEDVPPVLQLIDPHHDDPVQPQHCLHQELSLENDLCIKKLKLAHERNKNTKILEKIYEKHLEQKSVQLEDVLIFHEQMKTLLAMGEDAFTNLHSKYNQAKEVIEDCRKNDWEIKNTIEKNQNASQMCKEKYELLEEHGKIKLAEFKFGAMEESKNFEKERKMMQVATKHLQIKILSLEQQLTQKSVECLKLSKLYVEMIVD